jgi:hypothetical protein
LWTVIINRAGNSVFSFNNSNIIGAINVSGTGIDQLYNAVEVQYPLADIGGTTDYANQSLDETLWNPHETYKVLSIQSDLINNPVQAQYIGQVQLKQNRLDKIVTFSCDFSALGLKAGDLIDLTVEMYGYNQKMFRIMSIVENDDPNNGITLDITALEYDPDIYDSAGLTYTARATATGITPINSNAAAQASDRAAGLPTIDAFQVNQLTITADNTEHTYGLGHLTKLPYTGRYKVTYNVNWGANVTESPPLGALKTSNIIIFKNGSSVDLGYWAFTGDQHSQIYEDHFLTGFFSGTAGDTISYSFQGRSNFSPSYYTVPSGYPSYTVPTGALIGVYITADIQFVGV